jgi:ATP phosphoribosyltransferase regulatory subunit
MVDSSRSVPLRSLEHPLPAGMRDLLPEESAFRRTISKRILDRFALYGFSLVTPPVFEFAEVLERGLGTLDPADVLRFVEPESGEVAALRPDMTPQVARIIATRLRGRPAPCRLSYEGTVLRRKSGRARKHRQIPQVGVELAGLPGPEGDMELLALLVDALNSAGLPEFTLDMGNAGIVRSLLTPLPPHLQASITDALAHKDAAAVAVACRQAGSANADALCSLPALYGGRDALEEGQRRLAATAAADGVAALTSIFDAAVARGLAAHLTVDLGEVRGFAYYTGTIFHTYASGTGDAIGSGGRYDELLARFGWDLPAAGFAVDLDRLSEALDGCARFDAPLRVVVAGAGNAAGDALLGQLRAQGVAAVRIEGRQNALQWARAWGFSHVLDAAEWVDARTGASIASPLRERSVR